MIRVNLDRKNIYFTQTPQAFRYEDLYSLAVNSPSNYSMPRMWRAGLSINF